MTQILPPPLTIELLDRYFAGSATPEERARVESQLVDPVLADQVRAVHTLARGIGTETELGGASSDEVEAAWAAHYDRIFGQIPESAKMAGQTPAERSGAKAHLMTRTPRFAGQKPERLMGLSLRRWGAYLLSPAMLVVVGIVGIVTFDQRRSHEISGLTQRVYRTAAGQRKTVAFADGSRVLLGPATTLSIIQAQADASVDIYVTGEALFTIIPKQRRPFRVYTTDAVTHVLGTTFFVRQYATDRIARIGVIEGRVSLNGLDGARVLGKSSVLTANSLGTVDDSGMVRVTPHIAVEDYIAWTTGQLVFRGTPARDAAIDLGHAYGVEIRIADSVLATQPLTWTAPVTRRSLNNILWTLTELLDAHVVRSGRIITLVPGRSPVDTSVAPRSLSTLESHYGR